MQADINLNSQSTSRGTSSKKSMTETILSNGLNTLTVRFQKPVRDLSKDSQPARLAVLEAKFRILCDKHGLPKSRVWEQFMQAIPEQDFDGQSVQEVISNTIEEMLEFAVEELRNKQPDGNGGLMPAANPVEITDDELRDALDTN